MIFQLLNWLVQLSFPVTELDPEEYLQEKRITRILTTDFPQYFALVTRIKQEAAVIGYEGGVLSSTVVPQVQAVLPEGTLTKPIRVGLQVSWLASPFLSCLVWGSATSTAASVMEVFEQTKGGGLLGGGGGGGGRKRSWGKRRAENGKCFFEEIYRQRMDSLKSMSSVS